MSNNKQETNNGRDASNGRFLSGNNGGGRPKGSRSKLGEAFLTDLHAEWEKSGAEALHKCATDEPATLCKIVANLMPKEIDAQLAVNVELLTEQTTFMNAYRKLREIVGAEDVLLLEAQNEAENEN